MSNLPNFELINEVAAELEIHPAFVEKDWYIVQLIKHIASHKF